MKVFFTIIVAKRILSAFSTDPARQLDVLRQRRHIITTSKISRLKDYLRHNGDSLGMDSTEVGILEKTDQIRLAGLLKSHNGRALEPKVGLEILGDLPDETLEGKLADE